MSLWAGLSSRRRPPSRNNASRPGRFKAYWFVRVRRTRKAFLEHFLLIFLNLKHFIDPLKVRTGSCLFFFEC